MTNLSEKAKRRMELKEVDKALRNVFYELSNYPNWILNPKIRQVIIFRISKIGVLG